MIWLNEEIIESLGTAHVTKQYLTKYLHEMVCSAQKSKL